MGEPNPMALEVAAEQTVRTLASATALGGQVPTSLGPPLPLGASLHVEGQHWPPDARRTDSATQLCQRRYRPHSEGRYSSWKSILPERREEAILQQPHWLIARPKPILRPMRTCRLRPTQPPPNHLTLLQPMSVRQSFIRINMHNNRSPTHSTLSLQTPIHLQLIFIQLPFDIPLLLADHQPLLLCSRWHGTQMQLE